MNKQPQYILKLDLCYLKSNSSEPSPIHFMPTKICSFLAGELHKTVTLRLATALLLKECHALNVAKLWTECLDVCISSPPLELANIHDFRVG